MAESRWVRIGLRVATVAVLAFLYIPLIILIIYAFNPSRLQAWPPTGFTLDWFGEAWANPGIRRALVNSLLAGIGASSIALGLGTQSSLAVQRSSPSAMIGAGGESGRCVYAGARRSPRGRSADADGLQHLQRPHGVPLELL